MIDLQARWLARYRTISSPSMYGSMAWDAGASAVVWGMISVAKDVDDVAGGAEGVSGSIGRTK